VTENGQNSEGSSSAAPVEEPGQADESGQAEERGQAEPAASPLGPVLASEATGSAEAVGLGGDEEKPGEPGGSGHDPAADQARRNTTDGGGPETEDSPLRDDPADDGAVAGPQGEEGEQAAYDARLAGFEWLLGANNAMYGGRNRLFQAQQMTVYNGLGPGRSHRGTWSTDDLRELRRSYAPSDSHSALLDGFGRHRVQVLLGQAGHGRTTTALAAVADWVAPSGKDLADLVYIMDTDDPGTSFDRGVLPDGAGAVLVFAPGTRAPGVAWKNEVTGRLPPGGVLVVVADTLPVGTSAHNTAYLVQYSPPSLEQVFAQHLRASLDEADVAAIYARTPVRRELGLCRRPREAARLAADLVEGWRSGIEPEKLLNSRDPTELVKTAEEELTQGTRWDRAFLVSGTVFDRLAAGLVTREASRLAEVMPRSGLPDERDSVSPPATPIGEWSKCVQVSDPAAGSGRTAQLAHPRLIPFVLESLWQEHIPLRDPVLTWLKTLATHPDIRVRVKAAQAVAKLATYDFDVIRNEVLRAWADDGGFRARQAAAWALEALALIDDHRYAARVRALVRDWSRGNNVSRQAAGIAAYGTFLGSEYPDEALACMRRAAGGRVRRSDGRRAGVEHTERVLANIVEQSVVDVFLAGAHEKVVKELAEWTRMPVWRCRRCAGRCLVRFAGRRDQGSSWPILMELVDHAPHLRADVFSLWRNALDENPGPATNALYRLVMLAERADQEWPPSDDGADPTARSPEATRFRALVHELLDYLGVGDAPTDRDRRQRLRFHIQLWEFRGQRRLTIIPTGLRG